MSSMFAGGRPFSPLVGQPGHVRRQSGSAGGSYIAESLGFNRTAPNASNQSLTSRGSPQQRYQSSTTPLDSLSSSASTSGSSSAASTPQSSAAAAAMHRSNVMNQIAHAQAALSNLKQRTPTSASPPSSLHSPMPYPHPGHPHSLTHTPSTLSSASSTPSSSQQQQHSQHSHSQQPSHPPSTLKIKRKIRKNTREKQRRSELNDKFDSLQELLQLGGGQTKVEKYSVLSEAIQVIEMLRKENEELRSERKELRVELRKITSVLEHAFPAQPELAKEFTNKFFPHLSALSPHNVQQQQQQQAAQQAAQQAQQQQQLMGGGSGGGGSDFQFGGFGSGGSSIATTPSSATGGVYGGSITSPTSYLLFHQQQQQQGSTAPTGLLHGFAFNASSTGGGGTAAGAGVKAQPGHRRGNSRNGSTSSINFQSIYSQSMPGLGMIPPTPTPQQSLASLASINGQQHARKQSLTLAGGGGQHKRQDSLNKAAIDELRINPYFLTNNASSAANTATPGQSMSISPTSTAAPASFPFQSVFPSAASAASALPTASLSSFTHQRQPSTDFKFSLSSLNSLQSLHNSSGAAAGSGGGLSPSPPVPGTSTFTFPSSSGIGLHGHNRSMSGNNFAVNFNVTIPGGDDGVGGGLLSGPYDSPSAAALFGAGAGAGGGHGHHLSTSSLGGWVSGVVGGAAADGEMNDVASSDYQ